MKLWRDHLAKIGIVGMICLASLTSIGSAAWRAWHVDALPPSAPPYEWSITASAAAVRPVNLDGVLDADPFRFGAAQRAASAEADGTERAGEGVERACHLIGTVVALDGESFVMCDVAGVARVVRQGQAIGGWTLLRVEQGQAVFRDGKGGGELVTLKVPQAGGVVR